LVGNGLLFRSGAPSLGPPSLPFHLFILLLLRRLGFCLGLLLLAAFAGRAQTINVDAVTRYWQITDGLRQNQPLTDQVWQAFLEIPGNKIYVRGIYSAADLVRYRKAIEVVYMPTIRLATPGQAAGQGVVLYDGERL
jgi:hypothetical protein